VQFRNVYSLFYGYWFIFHNSLYWFYENELKDVLVYFL